jgi:hypothetical protein
MKYQVVWKTRAGKEMRGRSLKKKTALELMKILNEERPGIHHWIEPTGD